VETKWPTIFNFYLNGKTMRKLLFTTLALGGLSQPVLAEKQTMIVFDASGSMWGQIDGQAKISMARDAMSQISQQFTAEDQIGLMVYGHRQKGDCQDIELVVPIGNNNAADIISQVNTIKPKGKTPISRALQLATDALKISENAAEVVLITDGLETCDMNPCEVAAEAESLGIDFTAHVIGFDLTSDEAKQVACVADITGGQYLPASDAASLNAALNQVLIEADPEPEAIELPKATIQPPETPPAIGSSFTISWDGPAGKEDYLDVVKPGDERTYHELSYQWTKNGSPAQLKAPGEPGAYDLRYIWQGTDNKRHILARASFTVVDSEVSLQAPASVMAGENFTVSWQGPDEQDDYVDLVKQGDDRTYGELTYFYTKTGTTGTLIAPTVAGQYDIRYVLQAPDGREILHRVPIEVIQPDASLSFEPTVEIGAEFTVFWSGPNNTAGYIDLVKAGDIRTYGELSYFYLKDQPESGTLKAAIEPGDYDVRFILQNGKGQRSILTRSNIQVLPVNTTLDAPSSGSAGSLVNVSWQGPDRDGDYVDLVKQGDNRTYGELSYFYTKGNPEQGSLTLPDQPGTYTIRYIIQGKTRGILATRDIVVE
jgi:Ca-activated chloride channel family protein